MLQTIFIVRPSPVVIPKMRMNRLPPNPRYVVLQPRRKRNHNGQFRENQKLIEREGKSTRGTKSHLPSPSGCYWMRLSVRASGIHTMSERATFLIRLAAFSALYAPIAALFVVYWRCAVCG